MPSGRGFLRGLGRVLLGIGIAVGIFVAFASVMRLQHVSLPAVTGESAVGRTEIALTDAGRSDPFAADGRSRELAVWIWYPAVAGSSQQAAPYLPPAWAPLVGGTAGNAMDAIRRDAGQHPSPNAGVIEAAFAGALGIRLGGRNVYHGVAEDRGTLGNGRTVAVSDIARASRLAAAVSLSALAIAVLIRGLRP